MKLEALGEAKTLYPNMRTLEATEVLAKEGFLLGWSIMSMI